MKKRINVVFDLLLTLFLLSLVGFFSYIYWAYFNDYKLSSEEISSFEML